MAQSKVNPSFTGKRIRAIWPALLWRGVVYGVPVGFALGTIAGVAVESAGRPDQITSLEVLLVTIVFVPIALGITSTVSKKRVESFANDPVLHDIAA
jgi:hypothetical protein